VDAAIRVGASVGKAGVFRLVIAKIADRISSFGPVPKTDRFACGWFPDLDTVIP
jgi:hypothetical protein